MMLNGIKGGDCPLLPLFIVNAGLASVDGIIAAVAFSQLLRIHMQNPQVGWTRQKVFHLMIGSSNVGYLLYFISTLVATCERWLCWSHGCGFILMACPQILFLAAFLLLLSFWVDLCHQENDEDEDDEDNSAHEALLEKMMTKPDSLHVDNHRRCWPFSGIHIGTRQKFVILVILLVFVLMIAFAVLIWVGRGKNPIDSSVMARVYLDLFAIVILLLGVALAIYGLLLFLKMSKVKSEKASEMWKVAGSAAVSLVCFTSCAVVAVVTNIPVTYHWNSDHSNGVKTSLLIILYYFIGSSVPSAFVLWVMREMPPQPGAKGQTQTRVVTFIRDNPATNPHPQCWTAATSSKNQGLGLPKRLLARVKSDGAVFWSSSLTNPLSKPVSMLRHQMEGGYSPITLVQSQALGVSPI